MSWQMALRQTRTGVRLALVMLLSSSAGYLGFQVRSASLAESAPVGGDLGFQAIPYDGITIPIPELDPPPPVTATSALLFPDPPSRRPKAHPISQMTNDAANPRPRVRIRAGVHKNFGRLVFDWLVPISYSAKLEANDLVIDFDQPADFDQGAVKEQLADYIGPARIATGATELRFRLRDVARIEPFTLGTKVIIDLFQSPEEDQSQHRVKPVGKQAVALPLPSMSALVAAPSAQLIDQPSLPDRAVNPRATQLAAFGPIDQIAESTWLVDARATQSVHYDDNIFLREDNATSAWGTTFAPEVDILGRTEILELVFNSKIEIKRFNESSLNTEDFFVNGSGSYLTGLGQWGLSAGLIYDTTLTSEVEDTGEFEDSDRAFRFKIGPSWSYLLTPRDTLLVNGNYLEQRYESGSDLREYRNTTIGSGYEHQVSPRTTLNFNVGASFYETLSGNDVESESYSAQAGFDRFASEKLQFSFMGGISYTTTDKTTDAGLADFHDSDSNFGFVFSSSADYRLNERTQFSGSASQGIEPSADGDLVERRRVGFSLRHDWRPLLAFDLSASYFGNRNAGGNSGVDRDYFSVQPSVRWKIGRDWFLSARYRYRTQKTDDQEGWVDGNGIFLAITYEAPEIAFAD